MNYNDRDYAINLLDYYGSLLTKHQVDILNEYFNEDYSMAEISLNYEISKSAVQDLIKRSLQQLNSYENNLHLIEKDKKFNIIINELKEENNTLLNKYIKKLEKNI